MSFSDFFFLLFCFFLSSLQRGLFPRVVNLKLILEKRFFNTLTLKADYLEFIVPIFQRHCRNFLSYCWLDYLGKSAWLDSFLSFLWINRVNMHLSLVFKVRYFFFFSFQGFFFSRINRRTQKNREERQDFLTESLM